MNKWDARFIALSELVGSWSKDPSTKCGAVIVRPDNTVASVGYNGFPIGCSDATELYENRAEKYQRVIHAETNAVLHARERLDGYTLYTTPGNPWCAPCDRCATVIIQSGIKVVKFIYVEPNEYTERWREMTERSLDMFQQAGVEIDPLRKDTA